MKREDAEIIIRYVCNMLAATGCFMNINSDAVSAASKRFIEDVILSGPPYPSNPPPVQCGHDYCRDHSTSGGCLLQGNTMLRDELRASNAHINATNRPIDVWELHRRYRGRDINGILYELEELKAKHSALTTCQYGQSPVDIDAERFRWIMRNLGDRKALAAVMENPMERAEQGSLGAAGNELKVLIDGVRFRS